MNVDCATDHLITVNDRKPILDWAANKQICSIIAKASINKP